MSRNNSTYKPLEKAGKSTLVLRLIMIVLSGASTLFLLVVPGFGYLGLLLLTDGVAFLGWVANIVLLVFLLSTFQRMELDQNSQPVSRNKLKLAKISTIILIILIALFIIIYLVAIVLYTELGLISLSPTMMIILMIALIAIEVLNCIFYLITFIILSDILGSLEETRNLRFFTKFTMVYGIFIGIYHLIFGMGMAGSFLIILNPVIAEILLIIIFSSSIFAGIAAICEIIMASGLVVISRKLQ